MSKCTIADITCPRCGAAGTAEIWSRIDFSDAPEALQRLIDGKLFDYACPECGHVSTIDHDCCVYDAASGNIVQYLANEDDVVEAKLTYGEALAEGMIVRIVLLREQLVEKAALLRDNLDDRAFEVLKFAVFNNLVGQQKVDPNSRPLYKGSNDVGCITLKFVGGAQPAETELKLPLYMQVLASIGEEQPFFVDAAWASETLNKEN